MMNTTLRRLALAVSPLALAIALHDARAEDVDLGTIAVTARGYAAPLTQTPGGVAIADQETIFLTKKDSIADALATLPGISTSGDSAWGRDVSIRGMSGTSVVVLIDGKRINTATDVNARLGLINPMDVDRVEVLKGPVSALYGSGSTGGVINIITRKGKFTKDTGYHGRVGLSATTNGAGADAYGNLHYDGKDVWLLGSGGMRDHANFADGNGNDVRNSEFQDGQFRLAGGFKPTDRLTVELSALRADATDVGIPGGSSTLPSTARVTYPRNTNTLVSADATLDVGGENLKEVSGSLYYNIIERRVRLDQLPAPQGTLNHYIEPAADHVTLGGKLQGISEFGDHTVVAGFDGWTWTMESLRRQHRKTGAVIEDKPTPDARQTSLGLYAEDTYALAPGWSLNFGGRFDRMHTRNADNTAVTKVKAGEDDDNGWNLHAGATWEMGGPWSQSMLVGSSYRAADLLERFKYITLSNKTVYGNPDLKPETTLFGEWGLSYRTPEVQGGVRLFANKVYDYISEKATSSTRSDMTNIGEARILGVELDGRWNFARDWNLHGDVTAIDGRDETTDKPLRTTPPIMGKLGVGYERDGWFANLNERLAAPQRETPDSGIQETGGYAVTDIAAGYAFEIGQTKHKIALVLDNLFDAQYENYLTNARGFYYAEPGFTATLSYAMEF